MRVKIGPDKYMEMTEAEFDRFMEGVDVQASYEAVADMGDFLEFNNMTKGVKPPSTDCHFCHAIVNITDDMCWRCGEMFIGHELYERWVERGGR